MQQNKRNANPPIFWKEKEIVKQQIKSWTPENIKGVIYSLNIIEIQVKTNAYNPLNLLSDFILDKSSTSINN